MARPTKPLSAFPSQFRKLATLAATDQSRFPLSLPFATPTIAMDFRVQFYHYRRALRLAVANAKDPDSSLLLEAQGAELIQSPRIASSPDAPNGQFYCTFRLSTETPSMKTGLTALDDLLADIPSASPAESQSTVVLTVDGTTYSIPKTDLDENADLTTSQLSLMIKNDLLDLPRPLQEYIV